MRTIEFKGAEFAVADSVGLMPLLRFAHAAKSGLDSADMEGMAALYDMLRQCLADDAVYVLNNAELTRAANDELPPEAVAQVVTYGGWDEFEAHATKTRADDADLMDIVKRAMALLSERPTSRPSDSSDGSQSTAPMSAEDSSSLAVVRQMKSEGRPDRAMAVLAAQTG
jgi:hypothetical protein